MSRRPSPAVYRSRELDDLLRRLDPKDKRRRWIENMEAVLAENMFAGELIPKRQIPALYVELYGVNNYSATLIRKDIGHATRSSASRG